MFKTLATAIIVGIFTFVPHSFAAKKPKKVAVSVRQVMPSCGRAGTTVNVVGKNLDKTTSLHVGKTKVSLKRKSKSSLRFTVPKRLKSGFTSLKFTTKGKTKTVKMPFRVDCGTDVKIAKDSGAKATAQSIVTSAGANVEVTNASGQKINLSIPTGALASTTNIKVTTLKSVVGFPFSGGVLGAVLFEPEGLVFSSPAALTIPVPKKISARQRVVGFTFTGKGESWSVVRGVAGPGSITIPVEHFSGAGAALINISDFVATVTPILQSIDTQIAPLSLAGIDRIEELVGAWSDLFPPDFCSQPEAAPLCALAEEKIRLSAETRYRQVCPGNGAAIPLASEVALRDLAGYQAVLVPRTGGFDDFNACIIQILTPLVDEAEQNVLTSARLGTISALISLTATANSFGQPSIAQRAENLINIALRELIDEGNAQCASDPSAGIILLNEAQSLVSQFAQTASDIPLSQTAIDSCFLSAVNVTPRFRWIVKGGSIDFAAEIDGVLGNVTWSVSGGGTINSTGFFNSNGTPGVYVITATSIANPSLSGKTNLIVVEPPRSLDIITECFERIADRNPVVRFRNNSAVPLRWTVTRRDNPIQISNATSPGLGIVAVAGMVDRFAPLPFATLIGFTVEVVEPIGGASITMNAGFQKFDGPFYRILASCDP